MAKITIESDQPLKSISIDFETMAVNQVTTSEILKNERSESKKSDWVQNVSDGTEEALKPKNIEPVEMPKVNLEDRKGKQGGFKNETF